MPFGAQYKAYSFDIKNSHDLVGKIPTPS